MSLDIDKLTQLVHRWGTVMRVLILDAKGSTPREVGTEMFLWKTGQDGTVGGGALEYRMTTIAQKRLVNQSLAPIVVDQPLGPGLGQCCGGSLKMIVEGFDRQSIAHISKELEKIGGYCRHVGSSQALPEPVPDDVLTQCQRSEQTRVLLDKSWLFEKSLSSRSPLWIFGAGHVGRAITELMANLPEFDITWVDFSEDRFPPAVPPVVTKLVAQNPERLTPYGPKHGSYLVMTHSHDLDLKILDGLLKNETQYIGLIGSATKWARFRKRLAEMGHSDRSIHHVQCPIGDPSLGKHPWRIAVGVVTELIKNHSDLRSADPLN